MNATLPLYETRPIQKGDNLEEGSAVYRLVLTSPHMAGFSVEGFRFGFYIQSGTVGEYKTESGTQFVNYGGALNDPTTSEHFTTRVEAEAHGIQLIQQARDELLDQISEVMDAAKARQSDQDCFHTAIKTGGRS